MRVLYFNDQTEEFKGREWGTYSLGSLILKGVPYTDPEEAVDKKYVDDAFSNISVTEIKDRIPDKNFPGFEGDLTNKEGTNNFKLKTVGKAGRYNHPTFDNVGRVTGGLTGKLKISDEEFGGIDFGKFELGTGNWDKGSNWVKTFDRTQYLMLDDNSIHIKKPITINEKEIVSNDMVITERQMTEVSNEFFNGKLGTVKRNGIDNLDLDISNVFNYNNYGSKPWKYQSNFTTFVDTPIDVSDIVEHNITMDTDYYKAWLGDNHIYLLSFSKELTWHIRYSLNNNGDVNTTTMEPLTFHFDLQGQVAGSGNGDTNIFQIKDRMVIYKVLHYPSQVWWCATLYRFNEDASLNMNNTLGRPMVGSHLEHIYSGRRIQPSDYGTATNYSPDSLDHYLSTFGKGEVNTDRWINLPGSTNISSLEVRGGTITFQIGPYMYGIRSSVEEAVGNVIRIKMANGIPFGSWETIKLDRKLPYGIFALIILKNNIVLFYRNLDNLNKLSIVTIRYTDSGDIVTNFDVKHTDIVLQDPSVWEALANDKRVFLLSRNKIISMRLNGGGKYNKTNIPNDSVYIDGR